jgi:hypothetical protein
VKRTLTLLPFMVPLFILPFRGTVSLRLACLGAALLVMIFLWRRLAPPPIPCKPALLFWALVALLSLFGAFDPAFTLGEIKNEILYTMIAFVAFFAVTREDLPQLLLALLAGALVLCVWALESSLRLGVWQGLGTGYGGSGAFPGYAAAVVPMLFLLGAYTRERWQRAAVGAMFVLVAVTAFFSLQRIVWFVLGLEVAIALILLARGGFITRYRKGLIASLAGVVVLASGLLLVVQQERLQAGSVSALSEDIRFRLWPAVVERIAEKPLMGSGFGRGVMSQAHRDLIPKDNASLWHAHNIFLNYGCRWGCRACWRVAG